MLYTVKQTAAALNVSISFVYKLLETKQLGHELRGRRKLIPLEAIQEYRNRVTVTAVIAKDETPQKQVFSHLFKKSHK